MISGKFSATANIQADIPGTPLCSPQKKRPNLIRIQTSATTGYLFGSRLIVDCGEGKPCDIISGLLIFLPALWATARRYR
jgi:hypothetical protein